MTINKELFLIITFAVYIFQGILLIICNGIVELVLIRHRHLRRQYIILLAQIIFYFGSISLLILIGFIFSFKDTESILSGYCWSSDVLQPFFANLYTTIMIVSASLGVILYILVYLLSRKHLRRIKNIQTEISLRLFEARQRKLTITMGVSCVFTLIFYVLPTCLKLLIPDEDDDPMTYYFQLLRVAIAISCNLNPLTNIAAILIKQDDIACRVKQLFSECSQKFCKCDQVMTCTRRSRSLSTLTANPRKY
ncbi:hypothetical protein X798_03436 [Onchocerca flexuosa]|uniref:G-protein coupled receptors family 1 profile domain-containing protein n=1 Tax=Onchocerca flexuosa TaxID=387005 RepID=A0A238BVX2_9BILA|nr:hypothetical protein X798_03436 [Onchocerca flexuosa]